MICHNDWAPYNALFDGHRPIAMLDWDSAGPGPRVWDVALSAYTWVPLKTTGLAPDLVALPARATRLATFCTAYGDVEPRDALEMLVEQLPFLADVIQAEADAGDPGSMRLAGWNAPVRAREDALLLRERIDLLVREP